MRGYHKNPSVTQSLARWTKTPAGEDERTITLLDLPNPSFLYILILPPLTPPRNPITQILIPNHLILPRMTYPFFLGEPLPFRQRFRFGQVFLSREDGVGVGGGEDGVRAEGGAG